MYFLSGLKNGSTKVVSTLVCNVTLYLVINKIVGQNSAMSANFYLVHRIRYCFAHVVERDIREGGWLLVDTGC